MPICSNADIHPRGPQGNNESEAALDSNPYEFHLSRKSDDPEWDTWVANCPDPHPEQTSFWGEAQRLKGWSPVRILVRSKGRLSGGAQILERRVGGIFKVGYLNRGPLVPVEDESVSEQLVRAIQEYVREQHLSYLSVILPYSGASLIPHFEKQGFGISPNWLPPTTSMGSTIVLDLNKSLDALLVQMRATTRRNIRQSLNRGLTFREGGVEDLGTFNGLLGTLCARRGVSANIPLGNFVHELWRLFAPKGYLKLFLIEAKGVAIVAELAFTIGQWFRRWRTGWSGIHADLRPNELLIWEMIKWAKNNGVQYFDFGGFDTVNARAIAAGRQISIDEWCGPSFFKLGFGGKVLPLHPNYCSFQNPVVRFFLQNAARVSA